MKALDMLARKGGDPRAEDAAILTQGGDRVRKGLVAFGSD